MSKPLPLPFLNGPIVDKEGKPTLAFAEYIRKAVEAPIAPVVTRSPARGPVGQLQGTAVVEGRTEGIGTTVQQLNPQGKLLSTDQIAADGAGSPLTGGKRGFVALDANNRLAGSGRNNPVNVAFVPQSSTVLSNDGTHTSVTVGAFTNGYGDGAISYNASSFDPGSFGTWYAWISDPNFSGGVPTLNFSSSPNNQANANGNIPLGKITSANGSAKTGGGTSGGTTAGGAGGRGYVQ